MTQMPEWLDGYRTRQEMIEWARGAGFGETRSLAATFTNWQKIGLLGRLEKKAPRPGGEGLWHPMQCALWAWSLARRDEGLHLTTLVNLPVGLWLMGVEGVAIRQTKRAFGFWADGRGGRHRAKDPRSFRYMVIERLADEAAGPEADEAVRRHLRRLYQQLMDSPLGWSTPDPGSVVPAFLGELTSTLREGDYQWAEEMPVEEFAQSLYEGSMLRFLGLMYLPLIVAPGKDSDALWIWAREYAHGTLASGSEPFNQVVPVQAFSSLGGDQWASLSVEMNRACQQLLCVFGIAFQAINSGAFLEGWREPPQIDLSTWQMRLKPGKAPKGEASA